MGPPILKKDTLLSKRLHLWIFFDVGETLVSEKSFHAARNEGLFQILKAHKNDLTRQSYELAHERAILSRPGGESSRVRAIAREVLGPNDYYQAVREYHEKFGTQLIKQFELNPNSMFKPYPEVAKVLSYLSKRYPLGVIANQHRNVRKHLESTWKLGRYFRFMILSEEVGFSKPDTEMFLLALDKARVEPGETWMVGDRVDADIAPAKALGMNTIRVLHDSEVSAIRPLGQEENPDFQFKDLLPLQNLF